MHAFEVLKPLPSNDNTTTSACKPIHAWGDPVGHFPDYCVPPPGRYLEIMTVTLRAPPPPAETSARLLSVVLGLHLYPGSCRWLRGTGMHARWMDVACGSCT
jgi:hypothetical protein